MMILQLIFIAGIWVNPHHIQELEPMNNHCIIRVTKSKYSSRHRVKKSCDDLADEINRAIKESQK